MFRSKEIRKLLKLSPEELIQKSRGRLQILPSLDDLHSHFAESIAKEIETNNEKDKETKLILPVGPVGQYSILRKLIHERGISLKDCYFFFMDEYCDDNGRVLSEDHPLSLKGKVKKIFFDQIEPQLNIPKDQLIFPSHSNIHDLTNRIQEVGGIDTCYGGIGIHGHVAFNEPEPNVLKSDPRLVYLNEYTVTINAIRAGVGGNLVNFPRKAITLGMNQILNSRRIRLYCRNDVPTLDWANTVLRLSVLGEPGDDYPVTYLINHENYKVIADRSTAAKPKHIL